MVPLLDQTLERVGAVDQVVADKAFHSDDLRRGCQDRDIKPIFNRHSAV